ncbi:hypothetical protein VNO77_03598 [Canavalia gladiata]|uniref:Uncharacterized protein n=1 Tax=Canavalia gladiata TaxID=3824 RepID=A0AAN9MV56_CANGL
MYAFGCRNSLQSSSLWCTTSLMIHLEGHGMLLVYAKHHVVNIFKGSHPTPGHWRSKVLATLANNHGLIIEQIITSIGFVWLGNYGPEEVQQKIRLP